MTKLQAHHQNSESSFGPNIQWSIDNDQIEFEFSIDGYSKKKRNLNPEMKGAFNENWGLWDYDVVEVFIRFGNGPYLEIQCSPLEQVFALNITTPREDFSFPDKIESKVMAGIHDQTWVSTLTISFKDIPGFNEDTNLNGNCFSCLGLADSREYYALNINKEDGPDFHRPDLFVEFK